MFQELLAKYDEAATRVKHQVTLCREFVRILLRNGCKVPDVHAMTGVSQRTISRERTRDGAKLMSFMVEEAKRDGEVRQRRVRVTGTIEHRIVSKRMINVKQLHRILEDYLTIKTPYVTDLLAIAKRHEISLVMLSELIKEHVHPERYAMRRCMNCPPTADLVLSPHPGVRLCKVHAQANANKSVSQYTPGV